MEIQQFVVDAFTDQQFGGNPAAVCLLQENIPSGSMQQIASENALPETAFVLFDGAEPQAIKWFTPRIEMDLCGHATLASAHVLWHHLDYNRSTIRLQSNSGPLQVLHGDGRYYLDFPSRMPSTSSLPDIISQSLNIPPVDVFKSRDYVLIYEDEEQIRKLSPDKRALEAINLDPGGIAVTAPGQKADFVSRYFTPQSPIFEDPVTGSAHCSLIPYWANKLDKKSLNAYQLSERHGILFCEYREDRVYIGGTARTFSQGTVFLEL
ncbi:PhzF family phenazine biosynthesis protein [Fodinibius salsisoli]|uniref:PhzF family phenazine biosynthesis protein n=1 Tax=Fodinibius salsisoli TaxID=2820877 RepID=A0ABT3PL85_9BACT|nr:PhzF family phenazine biosynthesis protein [Fodinibius salsisoli]MCW9706696.1 PhzF family phenazine biosynthesis protein [Fodinibius salsisoli]